MCLDLRIPRRLSTLGLIAFLCGWMPGSSETSVWAGEAAGPQASAAAPARAKPLAYPHVTLSTWYEVDPTWPARPENMPWGQTPGVAVDSRDQVWVFTRADPPVQVYSAGGRFVRAWGGDLIGTPSAGMTSHHIKIDSRGHVWLADTGNHVVLQCTPEDAIWVCGSSPMPWREDDVTLGCPPKDQMFMKFDTSGRVLQLWTVPKGVDGEEKPGELNWVHGIALDSQGNIYAADITGQRAQKFVKQN